MSSEQSRNLGPMAKVRELEIMAFTKKYDLARPMTSDDESRLVKIPAASRDWMSSRGRLVVLLKARAGVTHDGSLNALMSPHPSKREPTW